MGNNNNDRNTSVRTPIYETTYWGNEGKKVGLDEVEVSPRKLKIEFTTLFLDKKSFIGSNGESVNYINTAEGVSFLINIQDKDKKFSIYNNFWLSTDKMYALSDGLKKLRDNFDPDAESNRIEIEKVSRDNKVSVLSFERIITRSGDDQLIMEVDNGQNIDMFPLVDDDTMYKFKGSRTELVPKYIDLILSALSNKLRDTVDNVNNVMTTHYTRVYYKKQAALGNNDRGSNNNRASNNNRQQQSGMVGM